MPSRFLTLWSMLANKPSSGQSNNNGSNKKKSNSKKDNTISTASHQVRYRAGYSPAMVIPIYGEEEELPVQLQQLERERLPPSSGLYLQDSASSSTLISDHKSTASSSVAVRERHSRTLSRSSSVFRRSSHFFRRNKSPPPPASPINRNHQSVDSLPIKRTSGECRSKSTDPVVVTATVAKSVSVGGLTSHRSSLRVCQAKRVAPPIVPDSVAAGGASVAHRHSGSSFDSTGGSLSSAESTASGFSGGYCSGSGGSSVATASWSSSSGAGDQRSSIGLDDSLTTTFSSLPPPPGSPAVITGATAPSACPSPSHPATPAKHLQQQQQHMFRGESEPVYSSRNPVSPSFGNPGGIFTYPSANNSNGIYGQIGSQHNHLRPVTMMESLQQSTLAVSGPTSTTTSLLSHPNYSHQLSMEDQGIDLTQSPGRESPSSSSSTVSVGLKSCNSAGSGTSSSVMLGPGSSGSSGSSCRHSTTSTTSFDSGRASGTYDHHHNQHQHNGHHSSHHHHHHHNGQRHPGLLSVQHQTSQQQQQRFSGQSYESCLRNSYHSSSSSLGSAGSKIDDIHRLNVCEMLSQGVPEHEILNAWLTDLGFEEYYDLFVQSGYDMHTITRMTPEDLTAIGIQKPNHRKKLKSEIALLHIPDGLPDFIPDTLEEWLALLGLAEYSPSLRRQGYRTVEDVTQLTWEDLEDFGILRLGHQKKITLAIKRVKDILAGKYTPLSPGSNSSEGSFCTPEQHYRTPSSSHYAIPPAIMRPVYFPPQQQQIYQHYQQQHIIQQQQVQQKQQQPIYNYPYQQPTYQPDVVAIQVHRNRSSEDVRAASGANPIHPAGEAVLQQQTFAVINSKPGWRQRSYEDGDVTPVGEHGKPLPGHHQQQVHVPGGGTLPRPRGTVKPRPVAKISAKTRSDCSDQDEPNLKGGVVPSSQYGTLGKKNPPPAPPKRASSSSITDVANGPAPAEPVEPIYSRNAKSSPLPLPPPPPAVASDALSYSSSLAYSDDSEDFPPPPAPITASDSYLQHHNGGQHPGASAAASVRERLDNILQRSGAGHWPARPQQSHYGVPTTSRPTSNNMTGMRMVPNNRECSPSESIDNSDTEPGSPAMEFRQRRNGSDASFKSTSSTESDSMPFANDNAGTIKQRSARTHPALAALNYSSHSAAAVLSPSLARRAVSNNTAAAAAAAAAAAVAATTAPATPASSAANLGASDVLNDIGNMLADLTDELDSMLEEESGSGGHPTLRKKS